MRKLTRPAPAGPAGEATVTAPVSSVPGRLCSIPSPARWLAVTDNGSKIVCWDGQTISVWDLRTGQRLQDFSTWQSTRAVAVTPDGRKVLAGSDDNEGRLDPSFAFETWDLGTGEHVRTSTDGAGVLEAMTVTPDGAGVICITDGNRGGTGYIWRVDAAGQVSGWPPAGFLPGKPRGPVVVVTPDSSKAAYRVFISTGVALTVADLRNGEQMYSLLIFA